MKKNCNGLEKRTLVDSRAILAGKNPFLLELAMPKPKPETPYKSFSIRLPEDLLDVVREEATVGHRSVNAQIEMIIERWVKTKRAPKPPR